MAARSRRQLRYPGPRHSVMRKIKVGLLPGLARTADKYRLAADSEQAEVGRRTWSRQWSRPAPERPNRHPLESPRPPQPARKRYPRTIAKQPPKADTVPYGIQEVGAMDWSGAFGYLFFNVRKPNCRTET